VLWIREKNRIVKHIVKYVFLTQGVFLPSAHREERKLSTILVENMVDFKDSVWLKIHVTPGSHALYMDNLVQLETYANEVERCFHPVASRL
jgi:hypothetical protein